MTLEKLAYLLSDIVPKFICIDGYIFADRFSLSEEQLREKISSYGSAQEAQKWINILPLSDFVDEFIESWNVKDEDVDAVANVFTTAWIRGASVAHPTIKFRVEIWKEEDIEDFGIVLLQSKS